jgi:dolichol-phosphate mannosyltransferase
MVSRAFLERVLQEEEWPALAGTLPRVDGALPLFRMLALQRWLEVSDEELIAEIGDRQSLRRFCGLDESEPVPSTARLAAFRDALADSTAPDVLQSFLRRYAAGPLISVISPVYRAENLVDEFVRQVRAALERITADFEIVLVEDGSRDGTWPRIAAVSASDTRVKGIKLSRNFGQHYAITAGLEHARGEYVVVMDCDLQDDPAFIAELYGKAREGYDVVLTTQRRRAQSLFKRLTARLFARSLAWMDGGNGHDWLIGGYSMLSRHAVDALLRMRDVHRHYLSLIRWIGLPTAHVPVVHRPRHSGKSSYTFARLVRHAIDGWVSHSNRLLYLSVALGFSFLVAAIALVAVILIVYFAHGFAAGWPSLVVLILTCTGVLLMSSGVLGIYVGKIFDQVRGRPLYVIERTLNAPLRRSDCTESTEDQ